MNSLQLSYEPSYHIHDFQKIIQKQIESLFLVNKIEIEEFLKNEYSECIHIFGASPTSLYNDDVDETIIENIKINIDTNDINILISNRNKECSYDFTLYLILEVLVISELKCKINFETILNVNLHNKTDTHIWTLRLNENPEHFTETITLPDIRLLRE